MRSYYALPLRQLRTRRLRVLLTAAGIVLGVGMICGVLLLAATIQRTFTDLYDSVYGQTDLVVSGSESTGSLPPSALDRVPSGPRASRTPAAASSRSSRWSARTARSRTAAGVHAERRPGRPRRPTSPTRRSTEGREIEGGREIQARGELGRGERDRGRRDRSELAAPSGVIELEVVGLLRFSSGLDFGGEGFGVDAAAGRAPRVRQAGGLRRDRGRRRRRREPAIERGRRSAWTPSSGRGSRSPRRRPRARTSRTSSRR